MFVHHRTQCNLVLVISPNFSMRSVCVALMIRFCQSTAFSAPRINTISSRPSLFQIESTGYQAVIRGQKTSAKRDGTIVCSMNMMAELVRVPVFGGRHFMGSTLTKFCQ